MIRHHLRQSTQCTHYETRHERWGSTPSALAGAPRMCGTPRGSKQLPEWMRISLKADRTGTYTLASLSHLQLLQVQSIIVRPGLMKEVRMHWRNARVPCRDQLKITSWKKTPNTSEVTTKLRTLRTLRFQCSASETALEHMPGKFGLFILRL